MKVAVEYELTGKSIADLFTSAVESGDPVTRGWVATIRPLTKAVSKPWYADATFWDSDFIVHILENEEEDGSQTITHVLTPKVLAEGLAKMALMSSKTWFDIVSDNYDAGTVDLMLQFACFGEEKYV